MTSPLKIVISGPKASGKTRLLRALGIRHIEHLWGPPVAVPVKIDAQDGGPAIDARVTVILEDE